MPCEVLSSRTPSGCELIRKAELLEDAEDVGAAPPFDYAAVLESADLRAPDLKPFSGRCVSHVLALMSTGEPVGEGDVIWG